MANTVFVPSIRKRIHSAGFGNSAGFGIPGDIVRLELALETPIGKPTEHDPLVEAEDLRAGLGNG